MSGTAAGQQRRDPAAVPIDYPFGRTVERASTMSTSANLFDERAQPDLRSRYGELLRSASCLAVAVTRVRLTTLDLSEDEVRSVHSIRVLIAELNALTLDAEARLLRADPRRGYRIDLYRRLLESGRLEVRSAPLGGWSPDFSVFSGPEGPHSVLIGFHWFERPYPHRGPALAAVHHGPAAHLAADRHSELWDRAHDVGPAVWSILSKAAPRTASGSVRSG